MKRFITLLIIIIAICISASAQKLLEPKLLGNWIAGEDPSEFLLHIVMEYSQRLLEENPEGKLIVRICSSDKFSTAFIKAPLNPLSASQYNQWRLLVPNEKIFIARSSKCLGKDKYIYNQYWFVPDRNTIEYEEIIPVNSISYKEFRSDEYESKSSKQAKDKFAKNVENFLNEVKNNHKTEGFIIHNSKNKRMRRNIEKVISLGKKEGGDLNTIKTVIKTQLYFDENGKSFPVKDEGKSFPLLSTITILEKGFN